MRNLLFLLHVYGCVASEQCCIFVQDRSDLLAQERLGLVYGHAGEGMWVGKRSGAILATGGGSVCRAENYPLLHQNGTIFWLQRDLALLPKDGRPISQRSDLAELYAQREPLYARFADAVIDNNGTPEQTVQQILEVLA